jgi:GT2 family glycosyltransferase
MLSPIDKQDIFKTTGTYRFPEPGGAAGDQEKSPDRFFLEHTVTGGRVETDGIGRNLLQALPASLDRLTEVLSSGSSYASPRLLHYYLQVFWKAGIICKDDKRDHNDTADKKTETLAPVYAPDDDGVSVIIIMYNGTKFIGKNLESLYRQTLMPREIIVIDNASTDGTVDMVKKQYPHDVLKVVVNKKNYHYSPAVNIGVETAVCSKVVILNQDIVVADDFIEKLYRRWLDEEDKDNVAGVVPQMRFTRLPAFINGIGNFLTDRNWGSDNYFCAVDIGQFDKLRYVGSACFGAIMVTKESWKKVGPLDCTYKSFYEDADWSMRAHLCGLTLPAAPDALVYHAFGGSYPTGIKLTFIAKNRMRFVLKHLRGKLLKKFFKRYLKQDIKNMISFLRQKSYRNIYYYKKGYFKLLLELPGIVLHRRKKKFDEAFIGEYFTKGAPFVALGNERLEPVINRHTIRSYYYFTEDEDFEFPTDPITL